MKTFLSIAGSDPSGGAGIQADIKTASAHGLYAQSVITALTIQNTLGVSGVFDIPANIVKDQCKAVFSDIFPDCVKIGMCVNKDIIFVISDILKTYSPKNIVLDTILISSSGKQLLDPDSIDMMRLCLFPIVDIITPNVPEAEYLTGVKISSEKDMELAAKIINDKYGCSVLLKGGHLNGCDLFCNGDVRYYPHKLIDNPNTHGTGCTLSSALACRLAQGYQPEIAVDKAIHYITGAIDHKMDIGKGVGPLDHLYNISRDLNE